MVTRPRAVAAPPAPPAYRHRRVLRLRGAAARPLVLAVAAGDRADHRRRDRRLPALHEDPGPAEREQARRRARRGAAAARPRGDEDRAGRARRQGPERAEREVPKGQVSEQNPGGGSKVGKGSTVTLTVSTGFPKVQVPNVVSQDVTAAVTALARLGLNPKITRIYSGEQPDTVTAQQPARRRPGDQGHDRAHQRLARREAGAGARRDRSAVRERQVGARGPGLHRQPDRRPVRPGRGRRRRRLQDPPPGTSVSKGAHITLSVSKGPATTQVPDVTN